MGKGGHDSSLNPSYIYWNLTGEIIIQNNQGASRKIPRNLVVNWGRYGVSYGLNLIV